MSDDRCQKGDMERPGRLDLVAAFRHLTSVICHLRFAGLVAIAGGPNPIPFRTRPLNSPAPMILSPKAWESRSLPGLPSADEPNVSSRTFSLRALIQAPPFGAAFCVCEVRLVR